MKDMGENIKREVARKIQAAMEGKGISKAQLADSMGKSRSEVTKWLSGSHNFTIETLAQLSDVLEMDLYLCGKVVDGYLKNQEIAELNDSGAWTLDTATLELARKTAAKRKIPLVLYMKNLVLKDVSSKETTLPKADLSGVSEKLVKKYSGVIGASPVADDERFDRIWNK